MIGLWKGLDTLMNRQTWILILLTAFLLIPSLLLTCSNLIFATPAVPDISIMPSLKKMEHAYTMNAGVRLLVFWMSWKDVGGGRISWIEKEDGGQELELLIGSDPTRAPGKINRWGYIVERISGSSSELIGIMTQSDEQSVAQARASIDQSDKMHAFKAIRSRSNGTQAQSSTILLKLSENLTYKDASRLLKRIPEADSFSRQLGIPDGADSGFLFAVKEMIRQSVDTYSGSGKLSPVKPRRYIYNASLFTLSMTSCKLLKRLAVNGHEYQKLIESKFDAHNTETGKTSHFSVTYGTDAPISRIPIRILYQPRWWFRAELVRDADAGIAQISQKVPAIMER